VDGIFNGKKLLAGQRIKDKIIIQFTSKEVANCINLVKKPAKVAFLKTFIIFD